MKGISHRGHRGHRVFLFFSVLSVFSVAKKGRQYAPEESHRRGPYGGEILEFRHVSDVS